MSKLREHQWREDPREPREDVEAYGACWEWQGQTNGIGYARLNGEYVHRLMYEMVIGPIPDGLQIDHLCRNTLCVNPWHLDVVTSRENTLRGTGPTAQNARKERCKRGHEFTPENTYNPPTGGRHCRACMRIEQNERRARLKAQGIPRKQYRALASTEGEER